MINRYEPIASTAFHVALISYLVFALADYLRPGFVSNTFSVHWFLLAVMVIGVWWTSMETVEREVEKSFIKMVTKHLSLALIGAVIFFLLWTEGEVFGDFRILLSYLGFLMPWILPSLLKPNP